MLGRCIVAVNGIGSDTAVGASPGVGLINIVSYRPQHRAAVVDVWNLVFCDHRHFVPMDRKPVSLVLRWSVYL